MESIGANAKMNEFQAAMGLCNLRHIETEIDKRRRIVNCYREHLGNVEGLKLNMIQKDVVSNYAYFPVVIDEKKFGYSRNEVSERLRMKNIYSRKYFYPLTNTFECFSGRFDASKTPVALGISKRVLTLPLYADLRIEDVETICNTILEMRK